LTAARLSARSPALARLVGVSLPTLAVLWVGYEILKEGPYS